MVDLAVAVQAAVHKPVVPEILRLLIHLKGAMAEPEMDQPQIMAAQVVVAHRLLAQMEPLPLVAMAAQAQHQASAARLLPMQAVVVAALMLVVLLEQAVREAVALAQIQARLQLTELPTQAAEAVRDRNIVPAQQARVVQAAPASSS
jgi:hypothetical protein